MKFSVLLSLYNKEQKEYLISCLNSLKIQTYPSNEIIIVFDGPIRYELEQIIMSYQKDLPIKIVKLSYNVGLGKALNEGLKHCTNEWVFRMDTDDICLPDRFQKQIEYIEQNPTVVLLGTQAKEFNGNMSKEIATKKVPINKNEIYHFAKKRNPFNHMTVAYKKSIIHQVGGYCHHMYMEDYNLWLRIIAYGYEVHNLPEVLVNVRSGIGMYGRRNGIEYIKSEYKLTNLKVNLKLQSRSFAYFYFILRTLPRLLPPKVLGKFYQLIRKFK